MIGSYTALILSHAVITLPIVIWVLLPSFDAIPRSVFEAAQVDGCSVTRILWRIAMPLVASGIAVAAILAFVFSWNYFLFALVLSNGDTKTLIAAAFNFIGEGSTQWGALMAPTSRRRSARRSPRAASAWCAMADGPKAGRRCSRSHA